MTPATIYDFYAGPVWLDSCNANEFSPVRLLSILAARWANVRMVVRGAETAVAEEDFGDWLKSVS